MGFAPLTGPEVRAATFPSHAWPPVIRATASRHHPGPCVMRIPHPRRRASGPLRRRWFSFPASLGAKFAAPHRPVVNFNGDGGFLFNAQLETAVRYGLRVVTVIMNNSCWGSEKAYQRYAFNERYVGADTSNPRYDKYAELFGATGFYVERAEDVGDAFLEALKAEGPSIIEIPTDPEEMPRPARLADVQAPQTGS